MEKPPACATGVPPKAGAAILPPALKEKDEAAPGVEPAALAPKANEGVPAGLAAAGVACPVVLAEGAPKENEA